MTLLSRKCNFVQEFCIARCNARVPGLMAAAVGRPLTGHPGSLVRSGCSILNTFTFESEKLRVLCRFVGIVGRKRHQLVTDIDFEKRSPDRAFSTGNLPTRYFLHCRYDLHIYAPDSVLSFLLQNRYFVGFVGKNQIL